MYYAHVANARFENNIENIRVGNNGFGMISR
jgi:hypothetical protein